MQPHEPGFGPAQPSPAVPVTGPGTEPPAAGAPGAPPLTPALPGRRPNRRLRLWLAMGTGILALLCLGGVGVFISVYDEATEIKRSAPDAVVDGYLRAYLVNRDDNEAKLYTCESGGDFAAIQAYRAGILDVERSNSTSVQVSWEDLRVTTSGSQGSVDVDLMRSIGDRERQTDTWRFTVADQDGWRVCGANPVA